MGKAYKEEEKKEIQKRLLEAGLEAFHDNSVKAFNIREVVKKSGISQGGFYNFYNDKNAFVIDIIKYRALQKMEITIKSFPVSSGNLSEYLSDVLYKYLIDLKHKADVRKIYFDVFDMLMKDSNIKKGNIQCIFKEWFNEISLMWKKNNSKTEIDVDGLANVMAGAVILLLNASKIDSGYFDEILKLYIQSNVSQYVKADEEND